MEGLALSEAMSVNSKASISGYRSKGEHYSKGVRRWLGSYWKT
jgi:hypothetical protein